MQAKAAAGEAVAAEKAAARLKVNSADANEAGRRNRATMVTLEVGERRASGGGGVGESEEKLVGTQ